MLSYVHIINWGLKFKFDLGSSSLLPLFRRPQQLLKFYLEIPSPGSAFSARQVSSFGRSAFPGCQVVQRAGSLGQAEL